MVHRGHKAESWSQFIDYQSRAKLFREWRHYEISGNYVTQLWSIVKRQLTHCNSIINIQFAVIGFLRHSMTDSVTYLRSRECNPKISHGNILTSWIIKINFNNFLISQRTSVFSFAHKIAQSTCMWRNAFQLQSPKMFANFLIIHLYIIS